MATQLRADQIRAQIANLTLQRQQREYERQDYALRVAEDPKDKNAAECLHQVVGELEQFDVQLKNLSTILPAAERRDSVEGRALERKAREDGKAAIMDLIRKKLVPLDAAIEKALRAVAPLLEERHSIREQLSQLTLEVVRPCYPDTDSWVRSGFGSDRTANFAAEEFGAVLHEIGVGRVGFINHYIEVPRGNSEVSMSEATLIAASKFEARLNELLKRKAAADAEADAKIVGERARHTELQKALGRNADNG